MPTLRCATWTACWRSWVPDAVNVLFVCTANSCRSQMAEAWARRLFPAHWRAASAGLLVYPISERTRAVMREVGLSLADHHPKSIDGLDLDAFDLVVTLSADAGRYLPELREPARHWRRPFTDPMGAVGTEQEMLDAFRTGRQRALAIVQEILGAFGGGSGAEPVSTSDDDGHN